METISALDLGIVFAFILAILIIGFKERKKLSLDDYWVNNRKTKLFALTATMSSTFIGANAIFALAGVGYEGGMVVAYIAGSLVFYSLLFAFFFASKIQKLGVKYGAYTLPEVLGLRYGREARVTMAVVILIAFALTMATQFLAIGGLVSLFADINFITATIIGGIILIAYISMGGLRADIRTDIFQFLIMILLLFIFVPLLVTKGGGFSALSVLPADYWTGTAFMSWPFLVAAFILAGPTVFVSPDVWQRAFAAESPSVAKKGMIWSSVFMIPFYVMAGLAGLFGKVMFPEIGTNSLIFQELITVLPIGLIGIALAGFLAAVMSSADTVLLILSQTIVNDLSRNKLEPAKALRLSRLLSVIIGVIALVTALILLNLVTTAIGSLSLQIILIPAVFGLFYWKRATAKAAFISILLGAVAILGTLPFIHEKSFVPGFIVSLLAFVIVSFMTKHSEQENTLIFNEDKQLK